MTSNTKLDLDVLAYIDGRLDDDPGQKSKVERKIAASPELAARIQAYRAQTEALREAYGGRINEPVPEHLLAVLDRPRMSRARGMAAIAAVVLLTVGAGAAGWMFGRGETAPEPPNRAFLQGSYKDFVNSTSGSRVVQPGNAEPIDWLSEEIFFTLQVPDLSDIGYTIIDKRTVNDGEREMVRLTYRRTDGRSFSLFLRPRSSRRNEDVTVSSENDVSTAYWRDGPLASAIVAELPTDETASIARRIRSSLHDPTISQPIMEAAPRVKKGFGPAVADGPVPQTPEQLSPDSPSPILPDIN
ncbi:MAG: hypothetical protein Q8P46_05915 [Hyphomicrobiales bacterium]|nr:hypothetical protein [Hyphomicrobiales bacterium]